MMMVQQLNNIEKNITINERVNWRRYAYMTQGAANASQYSEGSKPTADVTMSNPFDRGLKSNMLEFFFRTSGSAVNYHEVFSPPGRNADITSPVIRTSEGSVASVGDRERRESDGFV
uniref:Uncharacterized protein n=1 Tax=Hyaloperonospora arabidopsidis (strain Emoy2) TaxID=559515 RepID=M4BWZ2_HYAAE